MIDTGNVLLFVKLVDLLDRDIVGLLLEREEGLMVD